MEIKILKHSKNPLLSREEYEVFITSSSNPSFADVKKHFGRNEELTIIKKVKGNFGRDEFFGEILVYDSKEGMSNVERISRKERRKIAEEAKKAAAGAQ